MASHSSGPDTLNDFPKFSCNTPILPGYENLTLISESIETADYRALRQQDQRMVILRMLKHGHEDAESLRSFNNEFLLTRNLSAPNVIKACNLLTINGAQILVLEDFDGFPMDQWIRQRNMDGVPPSLAEFFELASQMVEGLKAIHAAGIIHGNLRPANIRISRDGTRVKIANFSLAAPLKRDSATRYKPPLQPGALAYLAPEQTGRINRMVDWRADIYSLGITFYELLTGRLPFESMDAMELVHSHLARTPVAPSVINPGIPGTLSDLVMKMMAKAPENRYQSARGLHKDLDLCARYWDLQKAIPLFALGKSDRADYFQIPEKLYGRSAEVSTLVAAFNRTARGGTEMVLVSGAAGIGKTAVLNELCQPVIQQGGYFARGSFDPFTPVAPFSGLVQALRDLMQQMLGENASDINGRRLRILDATGKNGQILINIIPELESIIGPQPPVMPLSGTAEQNRFHNLFVNFLGILPTPEHPLAICLDNLHNADRASLKLIQILLSDKNLKHMLLIGGFRDNEVSPAHPLRQTIAEIENNAIPIQIITLDLLYISDINQLIADAFGCSQQSAFPLTNLIYQISQGNPFFNNQLLNSLSEEGLILFDTKTECWKCDISKIRAMPLTDDILALLATRLKKLPKATQEFLKLASCIGNSFNLETLIRMSDFSPNDVSVALWAALQSGILLPRSNNTTACLNQTQSPPPLVATIPVYYYDFLHDRVRQAAYSLIPSEKKSALHLHNARLLRKNTPEAEFETKIFDIVDQFNHALELLTNPAERSYVASLNLQAGQKAKSALAYRNAWEYFCIARKLLPDECWSSHYSFTLKTYECLLETASLNSDFGEIEELFQVACSHAQTPLDKIGIFESACQAFAAQGKFSKSLDHGFQLLRELGITYPREPDPSHIHAALDEAKTICSRRKLESLSLLPAMTDPHRLAITKILASISSAAFFTSPDLFAYLSLQDVIVSTQYGSTPNSAFTYATYGQILCRDVSGSDIESAFGFGQLALDLVQKSRDRVHQCKVQSVVHAFVNHWKKHVGETLVPLQSAFYTGLEMGDFQFGAYSAILYCTFAYFAGIEKELSELLREAAFLGESIDRIKQTLISHYFHILQQSLHDLIHGRSGSGSLRGPYYDEERMRPLHVLAGDWLALFYVDFHKMLLNYLFGEYAEAIANGSRLSQYLKSIQDFPFLPIFCFHDSLARLAFLRKNPENQEIYLPVIESNQRRMETWARFAPMNCLHKYHLVEAERHRYLGNRANALDEYDLAIAKAGEHGYLRDSAIANELAATFFLEWGKEKLAQVYMEEAHRGYSRWGAHAKAEQLENCYPELLAAVRTSQNRAAVIKAGGSLENTSLDLATVVKASQAIASELELGPLLKQLMRIVIENAGAQCGALMLEKDGDWGIEAQCGFEGSDITVSQPQGLESKADISKEIIRQVAKTRTCIVLDDAAMQGEFKEDPCVRSKKKKSILCLPLINQGKLSAIVYLENNLNSYAFTAERLELLNLLSAHMALALDNARLFQKARDELNERKQAEIARQESEHRFRTIFDSVNDAIILHELNSGKILDANVTATAMYGYTKEEFLSMAIEDLRANESPHAHPEALGLAKLAEQNGPQLFEWKAKDKSGRTFWVEVNTRLTNISGVPRMLVTIRDISKRRVMESALLRSESVMRSTMEAIHDGLLILSRNGRILYRNTRFLEIWSIPEELRSSTEDRVLLDYVLPQLADPQQFLARVKEIYQTSAQTTEYLNFKDGRIIERFSYILEIPDEDLAIVWLFRDITDHMRAIEQIRRLNEQLELRVSQRTAELEQANQELEAFSYSVSHDLRSPLRAIEGFARILEEDYAPSLDVEGLRICSVIRDQALRMSRLIDDLLSFSRFSRAGMRCMPIDMESLVKTLFIELTSPQTRSRLEFRTTSLPIATGDPTFMRQVWENLLSNAIKFSCKKQTAQIEISATQTENESIYCIRDNGAGFDMKYADKLFGVFQRLHSEKEFSGTGVGLAIVQRIIRRHGGRIWAEGCPDNGAAFYFSLPRTGTPI